MSTAPIIMFVAGGLLGVLLPQTDRIAEWIRHHLGSVGERLPSFVPRLIALFLAISPAAILIAPPGNHPLEQLLPKFTFGAFLGFALGLILRWRGHRRGDPIESMLAATKDPPVAIFGRFANEDREMDDFMKALGDKSTRKLWRQFQSIPVDLDEDGEVLAKYEVDPLRGLQAMFFRKDGARIEFDGNDRIFAEDMLDPRRFETRLQSALNQWSLP